ncbi:MAG TPA: DPP IV N-terminal domain-containing protein [Acidobacteriota bacterium]|jgi:Tol biopolymer transport system component
MSKSRILISLIGFCLLTLAVFQTGSSGSFKAKAAPQDKPQKLQLTIDSIMRGPDLTGEAPTAVRWSPDSQMIYFEWKKAGEDESSTYEVSRDGDNLRKLSKDEARQVPPAGGDVNRDRTLQVFARDGDIFLWRAHTGSGLQNSDLKTEDLTPAQGRVTQLTKTRDVESNPRFTPDGKSITFTRDNNLFLLDLSNATIAQITDIRSGPEPKEPRLTDGQKFLQEQQKELFDVIRKQTEREEKSKREKPEEKPLYLQAKQSVQNLALSPGESYVSFTLLEPPAEARSTVVPSFVTKTGYTEDIPGRTKVGDAPVQNKMGIYHVKTQKIVWAGGKNEDTQKLAVTDAETRGHGDAARKEEAETGRRGDAEQKDDTEIPRRGDARKKDEASPRPRVPVSLRRFFNPRWSEDGKYLATLAESTDNKTRWIYLVDPESGALTEMDVLHDDAWIGPLSMSYGWMPDNQSIYFLSEKTGYGQLYKTNVVTRQITPLTEGKFEVSDPQLSLDKKHIYFTSNEAHPGERHLYSLDLEGKHKQRLTFSAGNNRAEVSPDDQKLAVVYSYINKPPELYVQDNKDTGEHPRKQITTSPLAEFFTYSWAVPEVITFSARDGALVYARL